MATLAKSEVPLIGMEGPASQLGGSSVVKAEPDDLAAASPGDEIEDDLYEDAGDLDFTDYASEVFLARVPKYLWKTWTDSGDEHDVQIGTIRVEGAIENPKAMSLMLSPNTDLNRLVPKEYNLQIANRPSLNTFVFTEKDLPGYNNRLKAFDTEIQDATALPFSQAQPRAQLQEQSRARASRIDKAKRMQAYYRRAIPKRTGLAGKVMREVNCLPVENEDFRKTMVERNKFDSKPLRETILMSGQGVSKGGSVLDPGVFGPVGKLDNFIKTTGPSKSKGQDNKSARIPRNELIDMITNCYKEYKNWYFKDLKARLKQPEAYLKQTLELVAEVVRQGAHAGTWQLKNHNRLMLDSIHSEGIDSSVMLDQAPQSGEGAGAGNEGTMKP